MEFVTEIPAECLIPGEAAGVWSGWSTHGDREVVREASAKGTHIQLAYKCLAFRRHCRVSEAQKYFSDEVDIWVEEMLNKEQIHRASHIMKNTGKDVLQFIVDKCITCKEPKLQKRLADYVIAHNGFEEKYQEAWNLINSIKLFEERNGCQNTLMEDVSIQEVSEMPEDVQSALVTDLYFYIEQPYLLNKLKSFTLWDYLLRTNRIDLILRWIDINYSILRDAEKPSDEFLENAFQNLKISEDMVDHVCTSFATKPVKELVLNRLSGFGVFMKTERTDVRATLSRLFSNCKTPKQFSEIMAHEVCNIDRENFEHKLFSILYHQTVNENDRNSIQESQGKKVYSLLTEICDNSCDDETVVQRGIIENAKTLSDDYDQYLRNNPLIVLTLAFLEYKKLNRNEETELKQIFDSPDGLKIDSQIIPADILLESWQKLPYLKNVDNSKLNTPDYTMVYELLDGYKHLNGRRLQELCTGEEKPNFMSEYFIKKYGRDDNLTYIYFLKQARPSMAAHVFQHQHKKSQDDTFSNLKYQAASCAHAFALENSDNQEITCACIAFIEMLDVSSQCLRLHLTAADYVFKALNISIYESLQTITPSSHKTLATIMELLENSFQTLIKVETIRSTSEFFKALKSWEIIVKFARVHHSPPPCYFLRFLACNNFWFEFFFVAHLFAYSIEQVLETAKEFRNQSMREHVLLALNNTSCSRDEDSSRLSQLPHVEASYDDTSDIWQIILECHQSQDPPAALLNAAKLTKCPIFTVLAACYEPYSTSAYCFAWLIISADDERITDEFSSCFLEQIWSARRVLELISQIFSLEYVNTVSRGFHIFMKDNLLCDYFEFLVQFISFGDFKLSEDKLRDFVHSCSSLHCNTHFDWDSTEDNYYLHNYYWIISVAMECTIMVLAKCLLSTHLQKKFLETLIACKVNEILHLKSLNVVVILDIIIILANTKTTFNFSSINITETTSSVDKEIKRCINELVRAGDFTNALQVSSVVGYDCSEILVTKYRNEFDRCLEENGKIDLSLWKNSAEDFKKYNATINETSFFLADYTERIKDHKERYELFKLALETLRSIDSESEVLDYVEMAMWKSCILAGPDAIDVDCKSELFNKLKHELLAVTSSVTVKDWIMDEKDESSIESLINRFIDGGDLLTALRINTIFNYKHRDLSTLMLCLCLAEGEVSPYQLTTQQKMLVSETKIKVKKLWNRGSRKISSVFTSSPSPSVDIENDSSQLMIQNTQWETLSTIEKLVNGLQHGLFLGTRIMLCMKLSIYLRRSYPSLIILDDPLQLLREVVDNNWEPKLELIGDIIIAYRMKNETVAKFLGEEIVDNIPRTIECQEDTLIMWGNSFEKSIQAIIDLCNDLPLLGWELLRTASTSLGQSHGERRNVLTLKVAVELLIRSHDCFSGSCSMEGIAAILRKAHHLAYVLQKRSQWSLLVRLVTGLGRFTEMNYVFQMLKENDQFEFLLRKGLDKIPGLKTAVLEFCKRQCPDDRDLFSLVALHFMLYNEIACRWENEAKEIINELLADAKKNAPKTSSWQPLVLKLTKNENVEKKLATVIENFTHATEYYIQDSKLNLASHCSHQAQLSALQMSLLANIPQNQQAICLYNLTPEEISRAICTDLTLPEALILVQAYNYHGDWSVALYNHVIINGETRYLKDFLASNLLTPTIVQDCANRYRSEKTITRQMTEKMHMLIAELKNVELKYVLASQLGFKSKIEEYSANPWDGAYLKDTIWQTGSKIL